MDEVRPIIMSSRPAIGDDGETNRQLADEMLVLYRGATTMLLQISADMSRWLIASLLAINGGGAVATMSLKMPPTPKLWACGLFASGVLCALSAAQLSVRAIPKVLEPVGEALGYWLTVKADGERVESMEDFEQRMGDIGRETARWPRRLGFGAGVLFACGAIAAGLGTIPAI